MVRARCLAPLFALVAALLTLPGCPALTSVAKTVGIIRPPRMDLGTSLPQDFEVRIHVVDQKDPPADYLLVYRRSGKCDYQVRLRAPKVRQNAGEFELLENQVIALYDVLREVGYAELAPRHPDDGEGPDRALGVQKFGVVANGLDHEVQAHFQRVPELEKVRALALSYLPAKALADTGKGETPVGTSQQIVGDVQTKLIYPSDDPRLKDVPPERRQPFGSWYDALNFGYSPAPGFKPWERRE